MKDYLDIHPWKVIESSFKPAYNKVSESIFSIGNGFMGGRANFEESYSGEKLTGNYLGGVYYTDKTRVGWWKIGYPDYYAKVLNAVNWSKVRILIDGIELDLHHTKIKQFERVLDMEKGLLSRRASLVLSNGYALEIHTERFYSLKRKHIACLEYKIRALNFSGQIELSSALDFDVKNEDSNYDEKFWVESGVELTSNRSYIEAYTKKTEFYAGAQMQHNFCEDGWRSVGIDHQDKIIENHFVCQVEKGQSVCFQKFVSMVSSFQVPKSEINSLANDQLNEAVLAGYETLRHEQILTWKENWDHADIIIDGDDSAQQAIRFNIFQLKQSFTGEDSRLNIGPKGYTGERYGGSTYWDTEAYCLPFYLSTSGDHVAKSLLIYRHNHLQKAIENAEKLGFTDGAALYPMVTMNGEECHNEWEITFEEIHRNGAIAYAIYQYIEYTGDQNYLYNNGLDVLLGIARFWAQRVHFSAHKGKYVMHGVTGPNEYENNVNNNWYTNYIACWCLRYTKSGILTYLEENNNAFKIWANHWNFDMKELDKWQDIIDRMYFPEYDGIMLQQDNYLDKEQVLVNDLDKKNLPLNQNWSWDRILRSCFIKQADVLQGFLFFEHEFDLDSLRKNFLFYEPRTVHESSLSPCVHAILASKLDMHEKAYEMYLRTGRLDLNDFNNDTADGLHITSMAGTWMSIVYGFGGMRIKEGKLHFSPKLPANWKSLTFKIDFRGNVLEVHFNHNNARARSLNSEIIDVFVHNERLNLV